MRMQGKARLKLVSALSALMMALAGCSTNEPIEQPDPVPEIEGSVEFDSVWSVSVGDGHDGEFLQLNPLFDGQNIIAASADGVLTSLNAENGSTNWERELDERIFAGPGADGNQLYIVNGDAELIALNDDASEELWRQGLPTEVLAAPQSNGDLVVVQTIDGRVIAFDASSGEQRWQYEAQVPVLTLRSTAAPLVGGDVVIASFANGRLIALSADAGQPLWQYEVGQPQGRTELERLVDIGGQPLVLDTALMVVGYQGKLALIDIRSGQEIWSRPASSYYSPAIGGGNIFLASSNGDVVALRGNDRRELWVQDKLSWRQLTRPAVSGDYLVVGDFEGYLHVLSAGDGSLVGQLEYDDEGIRVPVQTLRDGNLLVYGNSGELTLYQLEPNQ